MTPENIAGFNVPEAQLKELIDALREDNVVPLHPALPKAA